MNVWTPTIPKIRMHRIPASNEAKRNKLNRQFYYLKGMVVRKRELEVNSRRVSRILIGYPSRRLTMRMV